MQMPGEQPSKAGKRTRTKPDSCEARFYFAGKLFQCPAGIYYPSEDSCLLAENVKPKAGCSALDAGCGSGIQSLNMLCNGASHVLAVDINPACLKATQSNCAAAGFSKKIDVRKSDLFEKVPEKFDLIAFNPPYVESEEVRFVDLDGGKKGREVLDRFLEQFPEHLNEGGECYFLQTDINGYKETEKRLKQSGLKFEVVARKKGFFEELAVYKCMQK